MKLEKIKTKIKQLQDYLGPRVDYNSDYWPSNPHDRKLMTKLHKLKKKYYSKIRWKKRLSKFISLKRFLKR